jgi:hypothetical protein
MRRQEMKRIVMAIILFLRFLLCATIGRFSALRDKCLGSEYPRIADDGRVQIRIKAPDATKVRVNFWSGPKEDMVKQPDGFWTITTPPLVPGLHYYTLIIDGAEVADPNTHAFFGSSKPASAVEVPGQTYLGSQGNNSNYNNICFPEKEDRLPEGWDIFHVQKGYKPGESVVSTFTGWEIVNGSGRNKETLARTIAPYSAGRYRQVTLLMDPIVANDFKDFEGFETKEELSEWLLKNTPSPLPGYWMSHREEMQKAKEGAEPYATWLKYPDGALIPESSLTKEYHHRLKEVESIMPILIDKLHGRQLIKGRKEL